MSTTNKRTLTDDNDIYNERHHSRRTANQTVFESSPITDRASTFVAHFHPHDANPANNPTTGKPISSSLTQTVKAFQNSPAFSSADHRIAAWRRASAQRTLLSTLTSNANANTATGAAANANRNSNANVTYTTSSDDDGEKYAGKRLERVLNELNVQGTVVVARWYGGVMLGPVRFTHIENVAREAIMKWKRSVPSSDGSGGSEGSKRLKLSDGSASSSPSSSPAAPVLAAATPAQKAAEEGQRLRLVEQLAHRDNSIVVLRAMLAEKKEMKEKRTNAAALAPSTSTSPSEPSKLEINDNEGGSQSLPPPTSSAGGDVDILARTTPASTSSSPAPAPAPAKPPAMDYSQMPLQRLRQLEKARDATIAFILKQIDKAEEEEEQEKEKEKGKGEDVK